MRETSEGTRDISGPGLGWFWLDSPGNRNLKIPAEEKVQMFSSYIGCWHSPLETKEKEEIPLVYAQQEKDSS